MAARGRPCGTGRPITGSSRRCGRSGGTRRSPSRRASRPAAFARIPGPRPRSSTTRCRCPGRGAGGGEEWGKYEGGGLTMYGQVTAGSWIYIGTQGILQGTYETFGACAAKHFGGTLRGRLVLSAGLGGMGGAQPLAVTMNEGVG